jgi:hypothetical protein
MMATRLSDCDTTDLLRDILDLCGRGSVSR